MPPYIIFQRRATCTCSSLDRFRLAAQTFPQAPHTHLFHHTHKHHHRLLAPEITRLQIPRHTRQLNHQSIQLLAHANLTAQPASLGQAKRQIQHVVLVVAGLLHLVEHIFARDDDVAGRAGARAAARALHLEVVGLRDVEQVVAVGDFEGHFGAVLFDKGHFALLAGFGRGEVGVRSAGGCGEGARGCGC
jgi:hypothetical protein